MKSRSLVALTISGIMVLLFCLPASVVRGANPGWPTGFKMTGPAVHGELIISWRPYGPEVSESASGLGVQEAFLRVKDRLYVLEYGEQPWNWMLTYVSTPADVAEWSALLPAQIAEDFGFPLGTWPTISEAKDVKEFEFRCLGVVEEGECVPGGLYLSGCPDYGVWFCQDQGTTAGPLDHKFFIHCAVTINWLVPW